MVSGKGSIPTLSGVLNNSCKIHFLFEQTTEEKKGKKQGKEREELQNAIRNLFRLSSGGLGTILRFKQKKKMGKNIGSVRQA